MDTNSNTNDQAGTGDNVTGTTPDQADNRTDAMRPYVDVLANVIRAKARETVAGHTAYGLANMADCTSPDVPAGRKLLESVADGVVELIDEYATELAELTENGATAYDWDDVLDHSGDRHAIADGAPSIYTAEKWAQFVDLGAYNENPVDEYGPDIAKDLDQLASVALYMIADRLVWALIEEIAGVVADWVDENPDAMDDDTDD